jgi:PKHD-type hydroxylase
MKHYPLKKNIIADSVYIIPNAISLSEVKYLHNMIDIDKDVEEGKTHAMDGEISRRHNVGVVHLASDSFDWIYDKIAGHINKANANNFNMNLNSIECMQYCLYNDTSESFYGQHVDQRVEHQMPTKRKLSFTVQITDPLTYKGGDLVIYNAADINIPRELGTMIIFDSTLVHEVTKVTSGMRGSLVGWAHGANL